ncbi:MAG: hypothetical protein J5898_07260 [Lachnospiraceae bacterium]|nr:hypothetical protein [Lachnospiraceae bacterium]
MEMYQVEVYTPDGGSLLMEKIVFAESDDDAILQVQELLWQQKTEYGICMARALRDGDA